MKTAGMLPSLRAKVAQKAEETVLEALPVDPKLLRKISGHLNARGLKLFGALALAAAGLTSAAATAGRYRFYRAAMARELKKQLAPVNEKLDELQRQNEQLQKQNKALEKQLREK